jgi:hypothetical protein
MRFKGRHGHAESSQNVPLHSHHFQAVHCQRFLFVLFCTRLNDCISKVRNKPVEVRVAVALVSALEECIPPVIISTSWLLIRVFCIYCMFADLLVGLCSKSKSNLVPQLCLFRRTILFDPLHHLKKMRRLIRCHFQHLYYFQRQTLACSSSMLVSPCFLSQHQLTSALDSPVSSPSASASSSPVLPINVSRCLH